MGKALAQSIELWAFGCVALHLTDVFLQHFTTSGGIYDVRMAVHWVQFRRLIIMPLAKVTTTANNWSQQWQRCLTMTMIFFAPHLDRLLSAMAIRTIHVYNYAEEGSHLWSFHTTQTIGMVRWVGFRSQAVVYSDQSYTGFRRPTSSNASSTDHGNWSQCMHIVQSATQFASRFQEKSVQQPSLMY